MIPPAPRECKQPRCLARRIRPLDFTSALLFKQWHLHEEDKTELEARGIRYERKE
jgi:hypothetical protein